MNRINQFHFQKIKKYFEKDYDLKTILHLLSEKYNITVSLRTLLRILSKNGLKRKNINESPAEQIIIAILLELEGSGYNLGYRSMWKRLRKVYKLIVKQKTVENKFVFEIFKVRSISNDVNDSELSLILNNFKIIILN